MNLYSFLIPSRSLAYAKLIKIKIGCSFYIRNLRRICIKKLSQRFTAPAKQLINRHIYKKERYLNSCKQDKVRIVITVDVTS